MATGQVVENPSNKAVTRPTVTQTRDEDIDRKLRIYEIFQAFGNGKFPSNQQINVALTSAVESKMLTAPSKNLSSEGRELIKDLREVIDSAKYLWLTKNYNEEFQKFLYHTIQASTSPDSTNIKAPVSKDQAQDHGQQILQGLRTLGRLLVTNGQFRKLLEDFTLLGRDIAADASSTVTQKIRPNQDRLKNIDEPARDHTWHESPPSMGEIKKFLKSTVPGVSEDQSTGGIKGTADEHANQTNRNDIDQTTGATASLQSAKERVSNQIPDEHKEKAREVRDSTKARTKDYLNDKIPQERRDQTIYRLKKMVVEIQQHEDYMEAVDVLISLAEDYVGHAKSVTKDTHGEVKRTANDSDLQKAQHELKTLLENFADGTSMDDILDAADDLITDANNDPQFGHWARNLDHFIRKCLRQDGYILTAESTEEWNKLSEHGQYFLNDRYKEHTDRLTDEIKRFFDYMGKDPDSVAFGKKVQKLFLDLGQDRNGNLKFKPHLLNDVTDVIIPGFFENVRYVPIPRIEVSDPKIDAVIENVVVESENLMPNIFEIQADAFFRFGRKKIHSRSVHHFSVHVSQIQCDLKDVAYYVKKKQGFPSIKDTGVMDVYLGGKGLSFDMKLATAEANDRNRIFKVENVKVRISNLNIVLKQSNHKTLFGFFKPLLTGIVKSVVAKAAEVQIRRSFDQLDEQMWLVQKEYLKAKEAAKDQPPEETTNMVNMYIQAIQKRITDYKEKAAKKSAGVKVNVAHTKETSLFPNIDLPGGISSKATKYREMAREGSEWRSPIFDLGTANATSIPAPKKIARKSPHQNSRAKVNERQGTAGATGEEVGYTSLNSGGYDSASRDGSHIPGSGFSGTQSSGNGYQPRMSTATDSMNTAVEQDDFEAPHVGKYNVTRSQVAQDPRSMPYKGAKDTNVTSQDPSRQVY